MWVVIGALIGWIAGRLGPVRLAGGAWTLGLAGTAGGFVGGGTVAVLAGRDAAVFDPLNAVAAAAGAVLLVLIVRRAARVQPRAGHRAR
jgi:uncharacterized membrane protein YeaQ/YmgE (transglycosylase-associated protein family)